MKKPNSLRDHLLNAVPELKRNPDRILIHTESGKIRCNGLTALSFEYEYELNLILQEYSGDLDAVMIPLFDWIRTNQNELLLNLDKSKDAFKYETVILSNNSVDLLLTMPLSERVIVKKNDDGSITTTFPPEPQYEEILEPKNLKLLNSTGEIIAEWQSTSTHLG